MERTIKILFICMISMAMNCQAGRWPWSRDEGTDTAVIRTDNPAASRWGDATTAKNPAFGRGPHEYRPAGYDTSGFRERTPSERRAQIQKGVERLQRDISTWRRGSSPRITAITPAFEHFKSWELATIPYLDLSQKTLKKAERKLAEHAQILRGIQREHEAKEVRVRAGHDREERGRSSYPERVRADDEAIRSRSAWKPEDHYDEKRAARLREGLLRSERPDPRHHSGQEQYTGYRSRALTGVIHRRQGADSLVGGLKRSGYHHPTPVTSAGGGWNQAGPLPGRGHKPRPPRSPRGHFAPQPPPYSPGGTGGTPDYNYSGIMRTPEAV